MMYRIGLSSIVGFYVIGALRHVCFLCSNFCVFIWEVDVASVELIGTVVSTLCDALVLFLIGSSTA